MAKSGKVRLDALLASQGHFVSREAARRAIMAGLVSRQGEVVDKPGTLVRPDEPFVIAAPLHQYVSRGGVKLERALKVFSVDLQDKLVLDVGASTGGFTDCALQHGARQVYAVDVGYGQFAWSLRNDPRVTLWERTNFRNVNPSLFPEPPEVGVMDVSFISVRLLLPKLLEVLAPGGGIISLIKPQFEAGRERVGKGGIVKDPAVHLEVLSRVLAFADSLGLVCNGLDHSPISGGDGNIEFLAWWGEAGGTQVNPLSVVTEAWQNVHGVDVSEAIRR